MSMYLRAVVFPGAFDLSNMSFDRIYNSRNQSPHVELISNYFFML